MCSSRLILAAILLLTFPRGRRIGEPEGPRSSTTAREAGSAQETGRDVRGVRAGRSLPHGSLPSAAPSNGAPGVAAPSRESSSEGTVAPAAGGSESGKPKAAAGGSESGKPKAAAGGSESGKPRAAAGEPAPAASRLAAEPAQLSGTDARQGSLAAITILQAAYSRPGVDQSVRARHAEFVMRHLDIRSVPDAGEGAAPIPTRRIVDALSPLIASGGPPFPEIREALIELLGRGDPPFRAKVREAVEALIRWERRSALSGAGTSGRIGQRIVHNPPPSPILLGELSEVLWRADGRSLLEALFRALERNRAKYPDSVEAYLSEIRKRLRVDFQDAEHWAEWWTGQKEKSLPDIFVECQRLVEVDAAKQWQRSVGRLLETGAAARVVTEAGDVLRSTFNADLRRAAVEVLAGLPKALRSIKAPSGGGSEPPLEKARLDLQARAVGLLLAVARGDLRKDEPARVARAALSALREYRALLDRREETRSAVTELLVERLRLLTTKPLPERGERRSDLIEAVATAGELEIPQAREPVEAVVRDEAVRSDIDLLTEGVVALGRIARKRLEIETATLFCELFRVKFTAPAAKLVELRRACLAGLNAPPADVTVARVVLDLYLRVIKPRGTVAKGRDELRIPAILGLGTLARGGDRESLDALVSIVTDSTNHETQEIIAALDAIAYVGGRDALSRFADLLGRRDRIVEKDKAIYEHLWRKIVTLVKQDFPSSLSWLVSRLEANAVAEDSLVYVESVRRLTHGPEIGAYLAPKKLDPSDPERLAALWGPALAAARASALVGDGTAAARVAEQLAELATKSPDLIGKLPQGRAGFDRWNRARQNRAALDALLGIPGGYQPADALAICVELTGEADSPVERWFELRWIERRLSAAPSADARLKSLRRQWIDRLGSPEGAPLLAGLPDGMRERLLDRLRSAWPGGGTSTGGTVEREPETAKPSSTPPSPSA